MGACGDDEFLVHPQDGGVPGHRKEQRHEHDIDINRKDLEAVHPQSKSFYIKFSTTKRLIVMEINMDYTFLGGKLFEKSGSLTSFPFTISLILSLV